MNTLTKFSMLVAETDGSFICADGTPTVVGPVRKAAKLTNNILEAKNFFDFPDDIPATMQTFPNACLFNYELRLVGVSEWVVEDKRAYDFHRI